ncbi:hypothetical protein [Streptomyces sp. NPDC018833]|uniref:hypothetical protein n=1 Tax=Streptomyces sp. NPDC018833 TaxID=3365053 RepID=UPI0037BBA8F9
MSASSDKGLRSGPYDACSDGKQRMAVTYRSTARDTMVTEFPDGSGPEPFALERVTG